MLALLPSALAFRITGAELHEILGLATVAAFALHNILNRAWYRSLGRGRYNADRSAGTAVVAAIAACAAACAVSGVALSGFPTASAGLESAPFIQLPRIGLLFCAASTSGSERAFCASSRRLPPPPFSARARIFSSRAECPKNFSRGRLSIFTKCHLPPISARRRRFFSPRRSARAPCGNSCGGGDFSRRKNAACMANRIRVGDSRAIFRGSRQE